MLHLKLKIKANLRQQFWKDQMWREGLYKCLSSKTANSVQPVLLCCCARCYSHRQCWAPSPVLLGPVKAEHRHWQSHVVLERAGERGETGQEGLSDHWSVWEMCYCRTSALRHLSQGVILAERMEQSGREASFSGLWIMLSVLRWGCLQFPLPMEGNRS